MRTALKLCALLPVLAVGCDPVTPLAIIVLTNTWQEEGVPTHTIFFDDDTDGLNSESSGTFIGTETMPNGVEYEVSGYWRNSRVTMTTARTAGVTWRAPITEDDTDRLSFSSTAGTLVLVRNVN